MTAVPAAAVLPQATPAQLQTFLLQVCLLLGIALVLGRLFARIGLPAVVGELLAGVLVGPSGLGHAAPAGWHRLFPAGAGQVSMLDAVSQLGVLLLVGVTGAHVDLGLVRRRGATAARVSLGGLLLPLATGIGIGFLVPASLLSHHADRLVFALFLGVAMCVSAIPVIAKTLMDLKLVHRDLGQLALAAGVIDDAAGWLLLSVVSAMAAGGVHGGTVALAVVELVAFLGLALTLGQRVVSAAFRLAGRSDDAGAGVATAVLVVLVGALITYSLGLEAVFGAFVAGTLIGAPRTTAVISPARLAPLRTFVMWVIAPIFLAGAGLRMDLTALARPAVLGAALAVLVVAIVGKFLGAYVGARLSRLSRSESLALGAGMNARGVVEVVVALTGLRLGVLTPATYTIIVLVAVVTSLMAPPILRRTMARTESTDEERDRELAQERWLTAVDPLPVPGTVPRVATGGTA